MTVIPQELARVALTFTGPAVPLGAATTMWLRKSEYAGGASDAAEDIATAYEESIAGVVDSQCVLTGIYVLWGLEALDALSATFAVNVPGDVVGDTAPPNTAYLADKVGAVGGRHGRGRSFWPGVPEDATQQGGVLTATYLGYWQDATAAYYDKLVADDLVMALAWQTSPGSYTAVDVLGYVGQPKVATQRRRLRR